MPYEPCAHSTRNSEDLSIDHMWNCKCSKTLRPDPHSGLVSGKAGLVAPLCVTGPGETLTLSFGGKGAESAGPTAALAAVPDAAGLVDAEVAALAAEQGR